MCEVSRRAFLAGGTTFLSLAAEAELLGGPVPAGMAEAAEVDRIGPDVYFHQGTVADNADAVCAITPRARAWTRAAASSRLSP